MYISPLEKLQNKILLILFVLLNCMFLFLIAIFTYIVTSRILELEPFFCVFTSLSSVAIIYYILGRCSTNPIFENIEEFTEFDNNCCSNCKYQCHCDVEDDMTKFVQTNDILVFPHKIVHRNKDKKNDM